MNYANFPLEAQHRREPVFNLPPIIVVLSAVMIAIHILRQLVTEETDRTLLMWLAFLPGRYASGFVGNAIFPGGIAADAWTFVSYAFLHGDWIHLSVNLIWFVAFGSAVAWRFGVVRFLAFFAVTAAAGAAFHLAVFPKDFAALIGASAAISGMMAASVRFAFEAGGPLGAWRNSGPEAFKVPASPLLTALRNRQVLVFLGVWFALNFLFGATALAGGITEGSVAWQAHVGGFIAGLLLFPLFDPVPRPTLH